MLRTDRGLLVLDQSFLVGRMTAGLYWLVHDYVRDTRGETDRLRWTQAWGSMVEAMAEDELRPHAPLLLGDSVGTTYYTEEDLQTAFPKSKACDVVIDMGDGLAAIEIVSGQLTIGTRIDGTPDAFWRDMDKLVFKKMHQLDETASKFGRR